MNIRAIQEECFEANVELPRRGLIDLTFGNASVLDRGAGVFAIKPSGVPYPELSVNDIVVLDLEGQIVHGKLRPSSDAPTHRRLFQAFTGVRSVVHTHSRNAVAFAQAGGEFWANVKAVFTTEPTRWSKLYGFYDGFFLPYLVGGIIPGVVTATAGYFASLPMITAYQALRDKRRQARRERAADPR